MKQQQQQHQQHSYIIYGGIVKRKSITLFGGFPGTVKCITPENIVLVPFFRKALC